MSSIPATPSETSDEVRATLPSQLIHDLRAPLNQIIGYSEILIDEIEGPRRDAIVADLEKIRSGGHRMVALIDENFATTVDDRSEETALNEEEPAPEPHFSVAQSASAPGLLLVVDDDAANRDVLSHRLTHQGHTVVTASNGRDALAMMRDQPFDLLLLDIMMPDMDGYEVLGRIKSDEQLRHIPVIMISALSEVQSVVRCIEAGAEDYLAKPFNPTLLKARIGACLEKKRGRDRETVLFEQLEENYKRLQEVEKLRDDMRSMIVHDLRTPLTAVIAGVGMLESDGELSAIQREMMHIALSGGKTLLGMINDLLEVEKMEAGVPELQYDVLTAAALVADAVDQVRLLAEQGQTTLITAISPDVVPFAGDQKRLNRTLVNLIANAMKFTQKGTVTISASPDGPDAIRFAVADTGDGIPAEAFERIFEKFGQLDPRHKVGTGLGLAFCKLAVEAHGGTIRVESTPGVGSTFSFTIPTAMRVSPVRSNASLSP